MTATAKKTLLHCTECHGTTDVSKTPIGDPTLRCLRERGLCFTCNFWHELISIRRENRSVRVGGAHFLIGPEPEPGERRQDSRDFGFGGARFVIRFTDMATRPREEVEVVSHNLWSQGTVPARFRDRLPNNAIFLERG